MMGYIRERRIEMSVAGKESVLEDESSKKSSQVTMVLLKL